MQNMWQNRTYVTGVEKNHNERIVPLRTTT